MKFRNIIILLAVYLISNSCYSSQYSNMMTGSGNSTCEVWVEASNEDLSSITHRYLIVEWLRGLMSGINYARKVQEKTLFKLTLLTPDYVERKLNALCKESSNYQESIVLVFLQNMGDFPKENN